MDNSSHSDQSPHAVVARYRPNPLLAGGLLVVWVGFVLLWLGADSDRPGRLLYAFAAIFLLAICATDLLWTPRLTVRADGISVRSPTASGSWQWSELERVSIDERRHLGLRSPALEIDTGTDLVVLGRHSLGVEPADVLTVIEAHRPER